MTRRKLAKAKAVSFKRVLKNIQKYERMVAKEEKLKLSNYIEDTDLSKYLTKKGELRKNLSNKRLEEFNRKITNFKELGFDKFENIGKEIKKRKDAIKSEKRENKLVKEGYLDNKEDAKEVTELLEDTAINKLQNKGYINIYDLMDFVEDDADSVDDFKEIASYIVDEMEQDTPSEIEKYLKETDDIYKLMKEYKDNKATNFMTRDMFSKWLKENATKIKKNSKLNKDDFETEYKKFLNGEYNKYL